MWSTLSEDHDSGPGRDDKGCFGEDGDDSSADADESRAARAGWAPMRREDLLSVAPERTRREQGELNHQRGHGARLVLMRGPLACSNQYLYLLRTQL